MHGTNDNVRVCWAVSLAFLLLLGAIGESAGAEPKAGSKAEPNAAALGPWPAAVPGWKAPEPGEHPRLFFRKSDLPELRRRAATPEGQAILKRLRALLGGGEALPAAKRPTDAAFGDKSSPIELPEGAFSISHAAGFGMLYQLTGEKKYADLARQCFEMSLAGVRDRDGKGRYSFRQPTGALRAGPSLGWTAVAYDLAYDGWDEDFRRKAAAAIAGYSEGKDQTLADLAVGKRHSPPVNHWGPQIGGASLALLAVRGDPGVDAKAVEKLLAANEKAILRQLTEGWGDHGWFAEGDGPGTISSDTALVPALQAWRVAAGKDWISPRPNAAWMTLKWAMLTQPVPAVAQAKGIYPHRGVYDHNVYERNGLSGSGTFCQGFGAIDEADRAALLWMYNHTFRAADDEAGKPADTASPYPHRAILALVNWPIGVAEKNPIERFGRAQCDRKMSFAMFRNRWQDADDIIVTALFKTSKGNYSVAGGDISVLGPGRKSTSFPVKVQGQITDWVAHEHGGVAVLGDSVSFGVDFSGASGADALLVLVADVRGGGGLPENAWQGTAGGRTFTLMTLPAGKAPTVTVDGDSVRVGGQTLRFADGRLVFGSWK